MTRDEIEAINAAFRKQADAARDNVTNALFWSRGITHTGLSFESKPAEVKPGLAVRVTVRLDLVEVPT